MADERTDLERVGLFVDGPYDTEVTLYRVTDFAALMGRDPTEKDDPLRLAGPFPYLPGHKMKAATNDWTFSPFLSLWEDEPFDDVGAWRRRYAIEQSEKNVSDQPYVTTIGERSMNGLGTYYGTFMGNMEAFDPEIREPKEDTLKGLPGFLTSGPGKKGSGPDIGFSKYPEYIEDPAFDPLEAKTEMREAFEAAMVGETFIPAGHPVEYFDKNPFFDERDPNGEVETYDYDKIPSRTEDLGDKPPFIPTNTTKIIDGNKDVMTPFEKFPSHDPIDPWEVVPINIFRQFTRDEESAPWKAQFGNRTRQTRSVINYNIGLRVNSTNFHMF